MPSAPSLLMAYILNNVAFQTNPWRKVQPPPTFNVDYDRDFTVGTTGILGSSVEVGDWASVSGLHSITSGTGVRPNTASFAGRWTVPTTTIIPQLDNAKPWWSYAEGNWVGGDFIRFFLLIGDDNSAGANQRLLGFDSSSGTMKYTKQWGNGTNASNFGTPNPVPGSFIIELRKWAIGAPGVVPVGMYVNNALVQNFTSDIFGGAALTFRLGFSLEENAAPLQNVTMTRFRVRGNT